MRLLPSLPASLVPKRAASFAPSLPASSAQSPRRSQSTRGSAVEKQRLPQPLRMAKNGREQSVARNSSVLHAELLAHNVPRGPAISRHPLPICTHFEQAREGEADFPPLSSEPKLSVKQAKVSRHTARRPCSDLLTLRVPSPHSNDETKAKTVQLRSMPSTEPFRPPVPVGVCGSIPV